MAEDHEHDPDALLRTIFATVRTIALVGASANPLRPSARVLRFLVGRGYHVVAINPGLASGAIAGVTAYRRLADVPEPIDMVDVFRNRDAIEGVVDEVLALTPRPAVLWLQLGLRHEAGLRAAAQGLRVIMDRCPAIEIPRLAT